ARHPAIISEEFIYALDKALTPECHASTIAISNDAVIAAWFGGTKEKNVDVGIWLSRKQAGSWTIPIEVANGIQENGERYPCWNPVLFKPKDQPLFLFYKVGPSPQEWWGLYMTSIDDGKTWSQPKRLAEGILGPIKNQPVELSNGTILSPSSTESVTEGWRIHLEYSTDDCQTWSKTGPLNDPKKMGAIQPVILSYDKGRIQLLSRTENGVIAQNWSYDNGKSWSDLSATTLPNPNSGIDGVSLQDGRQLLVYNPVAENWGARVPLSLAISNDGNHWKRVLDLETAANSYEKPEYSYPTIIQALDGKIHLVYTWNRKTVKYVVLDPKKIK
ncbi:MAG: exo-alpha-sialidase, partial [Maribacter sp.]|nr:exo-alpha-sialidase [Maribacter sp.]